MEDVALFFHLLGAFSFVTGTAIAGVAFEAARRRRIASLRSAHLSVRSCGRCSRTAQRLRCTTSPRCSSSRSSRSWSSRRERRTRSEYAPEEDVVLLMHGTACKVPRYDT
jgi:hypothetical protein